LCYESEKTFASHLEITFINHNLNEEIMKKSLLIIVALATCTLFSSAQVSFYLMPKAGVSMGLTRMESSSYSNEKMQAGFIGGIALPIGFGEYFEVQPEFYYLQTNSKFTYTSTDGGATSDITRKLEQFELPILLKAKYKGLYGLVGPSVTFNSNGTDEAKSIKTNLTFGSGQTELKKNGWGMQFGVGYVFNTGIGKFNLDARYGLGLSDIDNVTGTNNKTNSDALCFTLGYLVPIVSNNE
jgi:Outer membrane protein beta-barrel domain